MPLGKNTERNLGNRLKPKSFPMVPETISKTIGFYAETLRNKVLQASTNT
jgi:hypothetical protein